MTSFNANEDAEKLAIESSGRLLISRLLDAFPGFEPTWTAHLAYWNGEPAGSYMDISEFAHFFDQELFSIGETREMSRALHLMDELFLEGDEATRDLIGIGFIEDIQNILSWRTEGHSTIIPLLPPTLLKVWKQIEKQWVGRNSLIEVIDAENVQPRELGAFQPSWDELLELPK